MNNFGSQYRKKMYEEPQIMKVLPEQILTKSENVCWLNIKTITLKELQQFSAEFISGYNIY